MPVNFQEVRSEIKEMGENALQRERVYQDRRIKALEILDAYDHKIIELQQKIGEALRYNSALRCAKPVREHLTYHHLLPDLKTPVTMIAVDGSQINYDRHSEVQYALINIGAIITASSQSEAPQTFTRSELLYDDQLFTLEGVISEARLALLRDMEERKVIIELAESLHPPVISLTDGPLEFWGAETASDKSELNKQQSEYQKILYKLQNLKVYPAGFVDNPGENLVIRMLELTEASKADINNFKNFRPLHGVSDHDLFNEILKPGARSAIFQKQSISTSALDDNNQTHFFYLNVSSAGKPWLARIEIPGWVAQDSQAIDSLQAALMKQCSILGSNAYPYVLHRAHEIALVTFQEKEQIDQMVAFELRRRGVSISDRSHKQFWKNRPGRTRYKR
ncbi:MAG: DNA double-strand break repair nuclease NurA [Chloroflexi bacterium]|nr:DNA double-strand break repair nuclease NurA [Chloroflexota bacterium]